MSTAPDPTTMVRQKPAPGKNHAHVLWRSFEYFRQRRQDGVRAGTKMSWSAKAFLALRMLYGKWGLVPAWADKGRVYLEARGF